MSAAPTSTRFLSVNGLTYRVRIAGAGRPLLLLHGFTGNLETWDDFVGRIAGRFHTVAVDLIGHGHTDAPAHASRYTMEHCVADLHLLLDELGLDSVAVVGYSMGGRVALHFALAAPNRVRALVLEGASPGIASATERRERIARDETLAASIEKGGVEAFVRRWEALPLFAGLARLPAAERQRLRARRLSQRAVGLAQTLRGMGAGAQRPLQDELAKLEMPTLLLAGEADAKYRDLVVQMAKRMRRAVPVVVAGAGHTVHLEQPERYFETVFSFLNKQGG